MNTNHKSSSHVQVQAENIIFDKVEQLLNVKLEKNKSIPLANAHIEPDFYSSEFAIVGEIHAHIGKPKPAQSHKIANDILKMLLLEKVSGREYRKILVVCDVTEKKSLEGKSSLAETIRQFGIEILYIELDDAIKKQILDAQETQKMTNV